MAQLMPVLVNSLHSSVAASNCLLGMVSVTLLFSDQPHELFRRALVSMGQNGAREQSV